MLRLSYVLTIWASTRPMDHTFKPLHGGDAIEGPSVVGGNRFLLG